MTFCNLHSEMFITPSPMLSVELRNYYRPTKCNVSNGWGDDLVLYFE